MNISEVTSNLRVKQLESKIITLEREVKRLTKACLDFDKMAEEERKINKELHKQLESYGHVRD